MISASHCVWSDAKTCFTCRLNIPRESLDFSLDFIYFVGTISKRNWGAYAKRLKLQRKKTWRVWPQQRARPASASSCSTVFPATSAFWCAWKTPSFRSPRLSRQDYRSGQLVYEAFFFLTSFSKNNLRCYIWKICFNFWINSFDMFLCFILKHIRGLDIK